MERLVESSVCPAEDASKYAEELTQLVEIVAEEKVVRQTSMLFKALANPTRLKILKLLKVREMCVCELTVALNLTQPTISHHLNILKYAGLLGERREGKWVYFSIARPEYMRLLQKIESAMGGRLFR
ncbi:MAG: ArsR/SmtB family transcription factor [Candidatus Bathyarchaeia archaeon]